MKSVTLHVLTTRVHLNGMLRPLLILTDRCIKLLRELLGRNEGTALIINIVLFNITGLSCLDELL